MKKTPKRNNNDENAHGITCDCPRCTGLRRYPQPGACDWCGTTHAGDSNNCPSSEQNVLDKPSVTRYGVPEAGSVSWDPDPQTEWICSLVVRDVRAITRLVKEQSKMGMKDMLDAKGGGSGTLLKGDMVPSKIKSITIEVAEIRATEEGWTAPAIIDLKKEVYGAAAWAVNKTNMKAIIKHFGDDEKKLRGKKIKLDVISVRNPSSGEVVPSLAVSPRQ